jgi:hypothetical protein
VVIGLDYASNIRGSLTGEKGDAFWILVFCRNEAHFDSVKMAARPSKGMKKKDTEKKGK